MLLRAYPVSNKMEGMTGGVSPDAGAGPGARPELRASHEDRDRAVEILRVAAGDGRLTAAELDERVEAALTARTGGELAALTADLPAVPGQGGAVAGPAKDVVRLDYQGGNATRRGQWVVPARMEIRAVGGTVTLDFTDAVITRPTLADPGLCAGRRAGPGDQARHRGGRRRDHRARRNGQDPAAQWLEGAGPPGRGGLGGEPRRPGHRPPAAADVPALAAAQATTACRVIPRLTPPAPGVVGRPGPRRALTEGDGRPGRGLGSVPFYLMSIWSWRRDGVPLGQGRTWPNRTSSP